MEWLPTPYAECMANFLQKTALTLGHYSDLGLSGLGSWLLSFACRFKLGADIFSPSQTWPHQHSPASLMMQTPDPQQRLSGAFIIATFFPIYANKRIS